MEQNKFKYLPWKFIEQSKFRIKRNESPLTTRLSPASPNITVAQLNHLSYWPFCLFLITLDIWCIKYYIEKETYVLSYLGRWADSPKKYNEMVFRRQITQNASLKFLLDLYYLRPKAVRKKISGKFPKKKKNSKK